MTTPRWLLTEQSYTPRPDRDAFIDKSVRSMLHVLSRIVPRGEPREKRSAIDARVKLVSLLVAVLLVSLSREMPFVMLCAALLLALLAFLRAHIILDVLKVSVVAAGLTGLILLPSALWGNILGTVRIMLKVFVCVSSVRLLSVTTEWRAMTRAMARVRLPELFVLVLDITVLYVWLLGRISLEMLYALRLRSVGSNSKKTAALSGIAGIVFLKSRAMAEDLYSAMECRCFTGSYRVGARQGIGIIDSCVLAANALIVVAFLILGG